MQQSFLAGDRVLFYLDGRSHIGTIGLRHATYWAQPANGPKEPTRGAVMHPMDAMGRYWVELADGATYSSGILMPPRRIMFHASELTAVGG